MADILDELIGGGVAPQELVKALRNQIEFGTAGAASGSKRLAPLGAGLREEALGQAAGLRIAADRRAAAAQQNAMEAMKAKMQAAERAADREQRARDAAANRALNRDLAALREGGADRRAQLKAKGKASPQAVTQDLESKATEFEALAQRAATATERVGALSAGLGSLSKIVPGSPAKNLDTYIEPLRSNLAFTTLAELKAASKTGASGLGSVTEREIDLLMSKITSLDTAQSPEQLRAALGEVQQHYRNLAQQIREGAQNQMAIEAGELPEADEPEDDIDSLMRRILEEHPELARELESFGG